MEFGGRIITWTTPVRIRFSVKQTSDRITVGLSRSSTRRAFICDKSTNTAKKKFSQRGRLALNEPDLGFGGPHSPRTPSRLPETASVWKNGVRDDTGASTPGIDSQLRTCRRPQNRVRVLFFPHRLVQRGPDLCRHTPVYRPKI